MGMAAGGRIVVGARMDACGYRVSGAEPAMVRYRLGCRRGGNGRRGGPSSLWAKARTSGAAVSLRLILAPLRDKSRGGENLLGFSFSSRHPF